MADDIPGEILFDEVLPPAGYCAREMAQGDVVRVIDIEGQQVVGLLCLNRHRFDEKLSAPNSFGLNGQIYPTTGFSLYSDEASRMMTITADTCGTHSLVAGACSSFTNELRYGAKDAPNCRDNFAMAVKPWGIGWKDLPYPINLFMNVPVGDDGRYAIDFPKSKPGDYVELTADMDVLIAVSNCPQDRNKVNAFKLTPVRIVHYRPK
jgi:uncharacterized protein YcgI (DUF1989 family)